MKSHFWLLLLFVFSCRKNENTAAQKDTTEENCFISKQGINPENQKKTVVIPTNEDTRKKRLEYFQRNKLSDFKPFLYDRKKSLIENEKKYFESDTNKTKFSNWIKALPEYKYLSFQRLRR